MFCFVCLQDEQPARFMCHECETGICTQCAYEHDEYMDQYLQPKVPKFKGYCSYPKGCQYCVFYCSEFCIIQAMKKNRDYVHKYIHTLLDNCIYADLNKLVIEYIF